MSVKEKIVSFRVTDEEWKWLKEISRGAKLSDVIREKVLATNNTFYFPETNSYTSNPVQGSFYLNANQRQDS